MNNFIKGIGNMLYGFAVASFIPCCIWVYGANIPHGGIWGLMMFLHAMICFILGYAFAKSWEVARPGAIESLVVGLVINAMMGIVWFITWVVTILAGAR